MEREAARGRPSCSRNLSGTVSCPCTRPRLYIHDTEGSPTAAADARFMCAGVGAQWTSSSSTNDDGRSRASICWRRCCHSLFFLFTQGEISIDSSMEGVFFVLFCFAVNRAAGTNMRAGRLVSVPSTYVNQNELWRSRHRRQLLRRPSRWLTEPRELAQDLDASCLDSSRHVGNVNSRCKTDENHPKK